MANLSSKELWLCMSLLAHAGPCTQARAMKTESTEKKKYKKQQKIPEEERRLMLKQEQ